MTLSCGSGITIVQHRYCLVAAVSCDIVSCGGNSVIQQHAVTLSHGSVGAIMW